MLVLLASVALAMEASGPEPARPPTAWSEVSEVPLPEAEVTHHLEADRERLAALLATEVWYAGLQVPLVAPEAPLISVIGPLLDGGAPRLVVADTAVAEREREVEEEWWVSDLVRSNARVQWGEDGRVEAVAFGLQQAFQGRGVTRNTLDVLVVYEGDRPSRIYASYVGVYGWTRSESLWTLTAGADGRVTGADELLLKSGVALDGKPLPGADPARHLRALRRTWTSA